LKTASTQLIIWRFWKTE